MSVALHSFESLARGNQLHVAGLVSAYAEAHAAEEHIVPVPPEDILQRQLGFVALDGEKPVGYVGATEPIMHREHNMPKVGSLCVWPEYRRAGLAFRLVSRITGELLQAGQLPFAFCNPLSVKAFEASGYIPTNTRALPAGSSSPYYNPPMIFSAKNNR